MKKGKFVLLEGFDGVGKTTISKYISNNFGFSYHKSPEGVFASARRYFDSPGVNFNDRLSYYSGVAIKNSIVAETLTSKGNDVIMDRYYFSLIAYHYEQYLALSSKLRTIYDHLYQPDVVICLEVDFKTICSRSGSNETPLELDDAMFLNISSYKTVTGVYKIILPSDTFYVRNDSNIKETSISIMKCITSHSS